MSNFFSLNNIIKLMDRKINKDNLKVFCISAMEKVGMSIEDAEITADVLVTTDLFGIYTHGTNNLRNYIKKIKAGGIDPKAIPQIIAEGENWTLLDSGSAMGMVESYKAMAMAIAKAKVSTFGFVGVKNGSHFGAAGYYANMAASQDLIGIAMSNADPSMTVPGSRGAIIGNNPFAYAVPTGKDETIFLDIAMSSVSGLKVIQSKKNGKKIPNNWIVDRDGLPTTDASVFIDKGGWLQPMAEHKGYGLALLVEVITAVLTGAGVTKEAKSWLNELSSNCQTGHAFIAINIDTIMPINLFKERIDNLINEIHNSPKAKNSDRIYLPGEIEWKKYEHAIKNGMRLPIYVIESLQELAVDLGLKINYIF
ncbi:MAG: Ldh family oxidoreductase [Actinobacteria bacterium]|nr:Ldh family oxidoreductase [Actinomycetota bacterium]MBM3712805.1 Ldh family oxidoreductase [Actinomycetota bacterium]